MTATWVLVAALLILLGTLSLFELDLLERVQLAVQERWPTS